MHGCKYLLHRANHNEHYSANSRGDYKYSTYKPSVKDERHSLSNPQATAATESSQSDDLPMHLRFPPPNGR